MIMASLVTDAELGVFVDSLPFGSQEQSKDYRFKPEITEDKYWSHKSSSGGFGGGFTWSIVVAASKLLRFPLGWELKRMGAENIVIKDIEKDLYQIDFEWKHWSENESKHRRILFFSRTDARKPKNYPQRLKDLLKEGIDFYFEKAGFDATGYYSAVFDDEGIRWREFVSITNFKPDTILIADHYPSPTEIEGFEDIESDYLRSFEKKGATFGTGIRAFLLRKL